MKGREEQGPLHILLVEDNPDHAELIERELQRGRIPTHFHCVPSGGECLAQLAEGSYDVVLLDYSLPQMNGLDILERINEKGYDVPVIMITGQGEEIIAVQAMKSGAYDYVIKSKDHLMSLPLAVLKAVERNRILKEKRRLEEELRKLTVTDDLTGLYNKRFFQRKIEEEVFRAKRQGTSLALLMFDLDQFKEYNDTHGHMAGDEVLKAIGDLTKGCIRYLVDSPCRYGGDEFVVILPGVTEKTAFLIAERIRSAVERSGFAKIRASIGIAEYRMDEDVEGFVRRADEAMYMAKRSGGNTIYPKKPSSDTDGTEKEASG